MKINKLAWLFLFVIGGVFAQENNSTKNELDSLKTQVALLQKAVTKLESKNSDVSKKKWYDKLSIGGYAQIRYNELLETNKDLECEQCDGFWTKDKHGLSFRRLRFKIAGYLSPRVYYYFQPDFAKTVGGKYLVGVIKDAFVDIGLDKDNEFRIRLGQSKVPYGFENLQSSSDRLPLDRNDGINSGLKDERDLGVFFYWATKEKRALMKEIKKKKLKHSGDFGVFALGFYNGQTGNSFDKNRKFHIVSRFSYPFKVNNQILELGVQGYTGKFVVTKRSQDTDYSTGKKKIIEKVGLNTNAEYLDQRLGGTFVLYPQPFGIQAEYNIGKGPEYDVATNTIQTKNLHGGYITLSYMINKGKHTFIPFTRFQHYKGGKKQELDARSYNVKELELGLEWHPFKNIELVTMYTLSDRKYRNFNENYAQKGGLVRLQLQIKF
ncbi:MAG: porin [Tenacibaculum sp.]|nr:porin [Tenacibaculum sp.]